MNALELLQGALLIKSTSGKEKEIATYLVNAMQELGFQAHIDQAGNAVGEIGNGAKTILLVGHMDTVPGDITVAINENKLYGRGAVDAKGPLCCFIAASALAKSSSKIVVVGAVEEECPTSKGARHIIGKYQPDCIIIGEPSGYDAITLGYKGRLLVDFHNRQEMTHTAGKNYGVIETAIHFFNNVREHADVFNSERGLFDQLMVNIQSIQSGTVDMHDWVKMTLGYRLPPEFNIEKYHKLLTEFTHEKQFELRGYEAAIKAPKKNNLVKTFLKTFRKHNITPAFKYKTGTSDMNILGKAYPDAPILAYGPGDSNLDHTPHEHIDLDDYKKGIDVLKDVLFEL